jgi:pimeloyl-ACP methyl ester carboxylesterase
MAVDWLGSAEAALNAVLGDYLERRRSALAIDMTLFQEGAPLESPSAAWRAAEERPRPRIAVLVHGMAMTEACWSFSQEPTASYGTLLRDELGLRPFCIRYNTGRRISQNGRDLAVMLEQLRESSPAPIEEISLIGHSMGGLVIRSACHHAERLGMGWIRLTRRAFYLGAPHLGSPFEKAGHAVSLALGAIDQPVVRLTHTLANLRSAGIRDLRHGTLLDDDQGAPLPLCGGVEHYFIAGTLFGGEDHWIALLVGDALVRVQSATDPGHRAGLAADHFAVFAGVGHRELARSPLVYAKIREWFGSSQADGVPRGDAMLAPDGDACPAVVSKGRERGLERLDGYRALLQDAVEEGATAIQKVQEELTARPYDLIELVPPLRGPTKLVRRAHFAQLRRVYDAIRVVNRAVGVVLGVGIASIKTRECPPTGHSSTVE